jgi:DNA-binding GntR family transcriptional regulator
MNLTSTNLAQTAYRHLRRQLLAGVYPAGTQLRYGPIGAEIGVSATPVREAANRLASEGFLEIIPNLGAVVRLPERREAEELYFYRGAMESAAVRLSCARMTESQIKESRMHVDRMRELAHAFRDSGAAVMPQQLLQPFIEADLAFHMLIFDAAGNRFMVKTLGDLNVLSRIFLSRVRVMYTLSIVARAYLQHSQIHRAIVRQDAEQASALMQRHISMACETTLRSFDQLEREERLDQARVWSTSADGRPGDANGRPAPAVAVGRRGRACHMRRK